jgi:glycosyltransferase involved in cell wall biosynthesis
LKIIYLNVTGQMGGAESSLLQLLAGLRAAQPDWHLSLILGEDGPLAQRALALGVHTQVLSMPAALAEMGDSGSGWNGRSGLARLRVLLRAAWHTCRYVHQVARVMREPKPDLIHSTGFKMHLLSVWARPRGVPVIWHIHDYAGTRPVMRKLLRWHSHCCSLILVNSDGVGADVRRVCSTRPRVVRVHNAVDLEEFSPNGARIDLDAAAGLPPATGATLRIGLLATFAKWKGHGVFLEALSLLAADRPVRGYVIGGPIYRTEGSQHSLMELRAEAHRLGLAEKIGFTGFVAEPAAALRALDVIVHASTRPEPFGMVIVEGMACGKAVVASVASGAAEILSHGQNLLVYPCGDAGKLAQSIMTVLDEPELRARLGTAGRRSVEALFQKSRLAAELIDIYHQCASFT